MKSLTSVAFLLLLSLPVQAQLQMAELFTDNMVIQRDQPIRIWGWAAPKGQVSILLGEQTHTTKADDTGRWSIKLPPRAAGGPYQMTVSSKNQRITLKNLLIGDVWLCGGQSNMEWPMARFPSSQADIEDAVDTQIRHFKVPLNWSENPSEHLDSARWAINGPTETGSFTAMGFYFAKSLREHDNVPIGLINSTWGGSRIEPWMSEESLRPFGIDNAAEQMALSQQKQQQEIDDIRALASPLAQNEEIVQAHAPDFDDAAWRDVPLPNLWEDVGYPGMNGTAYYRRVVSLTDVEAEHGVTLRLGKIDDADWTYVNGQLVGHTDQWDAKRVYKVEPEQLKEGANVILIKVVDTLYGGGLYGAPEDLYYSSVLGKTSLVGQWKFRIQEITKLEGSGISENKTPIILYNKMIHPLLDFPIKGIIWYQGTSNALNANDATEYRDLFKALIDDWRKRWVTEGLPFLWCQVANFEEEAEVPEDHPWGIMRASQSAALALPNTAQVIIVDIGDPEDIHPDNKQEAGRRLSLAARKLAYGEEDIVHSGPVYKSVEIDNGSLLIDFDHKGSGLMTRNKYGFIRAFAVAGDDGVFHWAWAKIEDDKVRIWSDRVTAPRHVRYAWSKNPGVIDLYNREGLPASPFRTDMP